MRGQADYGLYAPKTVTASISDMGEVAARLGSIVTYDKRGDVVDFDNFEAPILKWATTEDEGDVYLHSVDAKSGSQSVALATDAGLGDSVWIQKTLNVTPSRRLGLEFSFGSVLTGLLYMLPVYRDGTLQHRPYVMLDLTNHLLYVFDGDLGAYTLVGDTGHFHFGLGTFFFYTLKLVCDLNTDRFVRIMLGNLEWDISTIPIQTLGPPSAPYLQVDIGRENDTAIARLTSIDDFIFTQAEP